MRGYSPCPSANGPVLRYTRLKSEPSPALYFVTAMALIAETGVLLHGTAYLGGYYIYSRWSGVVSLLLLD